LLLLAKGARIALLVSSFNTGDDGWSPNVAWVNILSLFLGGRVKNIARGFIPACMWVVDRNFITTVAVFILVKNLLGR